MNALASRILLLLRLKGGPEDLPASWPLTLAVIAVYLAEEFVTTQTVASSADGMRSVIADLFVFLAVIAVLRFKKFPERIEQTLLALAGTGIALGFVAFLFVIQADPNVNQPFLAIIFFGIFGWQLAVVGNIFKHALSTTMSSGVLLTVILLAASYVVLELAFK